ncbi:MAG TPA: SprT family zinc-dependent metalloprotease [Anaerolineales bacterium]|nr:SprT family zinc-dependent metalloprotease [Anaerolineales bacterium]
MPFEVNQIIRSKRKTLALIVMPDGSLIVRAPLLTPEKLVREFIENNARWIEKKQTEALDARPPVPKQYIPGEMFMYLGNTYPLEIVQHQKAPLLFEKNFKLAKSAQSEAAWAFEQWYRSQAKQTLNERVNLYANQYDLHYKAIKITSARTRWGSCSADGSLNFSWRLILAPMDVVDYVVVHELVHTVLHNHSRRFWKRVEKIMPDYKERRKWLRKNGRQLMV